MLINLSLVLLQEGNVSYCSFLGHIIFPVLPSTVQANNAVSTVNKMRIIHLLV